MSRILRISDSCISQRGIAIKPTVNQKILDGGTSRLGDGKAEVSFWVAGGAGEGPKSSWVGMSHTAHDTAAGRHRQFSAGAQDAGATGACMAGYHIGYRMALYDVYVRSAVADPERTSSGCAGVDCLGMELCQLCSRQGDDSAKLAQAAVMPCKHVCACADCVEDLVVRSPDCHPTYSTLSLCGCSDVARKR